jgi:hypothetical protein
MQEWASKDLPSLINARAEEEALDDYLSSKDVVLIENERCNLKNLYESES